MLHPARGRVLDVPSSLLVRHPDLPRDPAIPQRPNTDGVPLLVVAAASPSDPLYVLDRHGHFDWSAAHERVTVCVIDADTGALCVAHFKQIASGDAPSADDRHRVRMRLVAAGVPHDVLALQTGCTADQIRQYRTVWNDRPEAAEAFLAGRTTWRQAQRAASPRTRSKHVPIPEAGVSLPRHPGPAAREWVPEADPHWIPHVPFVQACALAFTWEHAPTILLIGPHGTGRSHNVAQVAAAMHAPLRFVRCAWDLSERELFGGPEIRGGETVFVPGLLPAAYALGHQVCLQDVWELRPALLRALHPFMEGAPWIQRPDGVTVRRAPGFALYLTSAPPGPDATPTDAATLSRAPLRVAFEAHDETTVTELLARWAGGRSGEPDPAVRRGLVRWFMRMQHLSREINGDVVYVPTLRDLQALWRACLSPILGLDGEPLSLSVLDLADRTVLPALPAGVARDSARELLRAFVGERRPR